MPYRVVDSTLTAVYCSNAAARLDIEPISVANAIRLALSKR